MDLEQYITSFSSETQIYFMYMYTLHVVYDNWINNENSFIIDFWISDIIPVANKYLKVTEWQNNLNLVVCITFMLDRIFIQKI